MWCTMLPWGIVVYDNAFGELLYTILCYTNVNTKPSYDAGRAAIVRGSVTTGLQFSTDKVLRPVQMGRGHLLKWNHANWRPSKCERDGQITLCTWTFQIDDFSFSSFVYVFQNNSCSGMTKFGPGSTRVCLTCRTESYYVSTWIVLGATMTMMKNRTANKR